MLQLQIFAAAVAVVAVAVGLLADSYRRKWRDTVDRLGFQLQENGRLRAINRQAHEAWARDSVIWNERLDAARARMAEIATLVSRRPPRRRWLAVARNVAKIAANGV